MADEPVSISSTDDRARIEEQLVSYLDGELDDSQVRQVEALLASDPKVRDQLARLERTWSLLDGLERPQVDEVFTRSTIEMVALQEESALSRQRAEAPRRRRRRWLIGGIGLLAAILAGFLTVAAFWPEPDRQFLRDLPLLEDYAELNQIDDVEFLQMLYDRGLFVKDAPDER
jgi:anti-sigma factor RsiW